MSKEATVKQSQFNLGRQKDGVLLVTLFGNWTLENGVPSFAELEQEIQSAPPVRRIAFDAERVTDWDTSLLTFLNKLVDHCTPRKIELETSGLPDGLRELLDLATAVPEKKGARRESARVSFFARVGKAVLAGRESSLEMLRFLGEVLLAFLNLLRGKARFRASDLWLIVQQTGAQALGIVSLISFLVGLILAFIGAIQLQQFGAQIYVANLVGIAMAREMGAMMTGIIMAGRTGAAFAAQLGTMTVNEEIDALSTMGVPPMEFLVLPRMLALMLMMPLLCMYSDLLGILGGFVVGVGMLELGPVQYLTQTQAALTLTDFAIGLIKSAIYGVLIAIAGCLRGVQCGRSASAVGAATTSAVVTAIVLIVIASALTTVITNVLEV